MAKEILEIPTCTKCFKYQIKLTRFSYDKCDNCNSLLIIKRFVEEKNEKPINRNTN